MGTIWDLLVCDMGCPMYPGMSRVVLGQAVAVLDIPRLYEPLLPSWAMAVPFFGELSHFCAVFT